MSLDKEIKNYIMSNIPFEEGSQLEDQITVCRLVDYHRTVNKVGGFMGHPDDITHREKMMEAIEFILKDYLSKGDFDKVMELAHQDLEG